MLLLWRGCTVVVCDSMACLLSSMLLLMFSFPCCGVYCMLLFTVVQFYSPGRVSVKSS